jgi:hypothetical protein
VLARRSFFCLMASLVACLADSSVSRSEMVYVSGFFDGGVYRFDSADPTGTFGAVPNIGTLASPTGLAFGPDGHLYIAVSAAFGGTPSIARYNVASQTLESNVYDFLDSFRPSSLAFKGNDLLVGSNPLGAYTGPIVQLTDIVNQSPNRTNYTSNGSLATSPGIALSGNGTLYVADQTYSFPTASGPVKRFDATGEFIDVLIPDAAPLSGPTGLVIHGNNLYTSSIMNGSILVTNLLDDSTEVFAPNLDFPDPLNLVPGSLAALADGNLLVGDADGTSLSELIRVGTDGSIVGEYSFGVGAIGGITVAPVPEPATIMLVASGIVAGAVSIRRRRSKTVS